MFSGCVYDKPSQNEFSPQNVDELTASDLDSMQLKGLPIRAAHGKYQGKDIGTITDEWSGPDGSKYISFEITDKPEYLAYKEGINQKWYTHLSLGHDVHPSKGMVPREVSICHLGARDNTLIANPDMSAEEYKHATLKQFTHDKMAEQKEVMDTQPDAAPAEAEAPPAPELSPEERALNIIKELPADQQEIIAKGWTSTSARLEKMNEELQRTKSALDKSTQENETLKVATKTVAEDLVKSIKEAYEEYGSAPPERYMREIESQTCGNPTLAQAMQHAIPVLAAAGQKRRRADAAATSSLSNLESYLRAHVRSDMVPAFVGDFEAAQPRRVEASAAPAKQEDATSRMLNNLRKSLRQ